MARHTSQTVLSDLERLKKLKEELLKGQHPYYEPVPRPDVLESLSLVHNPPTQDDASAADLGPNQHYLGLPLSHTDATGMQGDLKSHNDTSHHQRTARPPGTRFGPGISVEITDADSKPASPASASQALPSSAESNDSSASAPVRNGSSEPPSRVSRFGTPPQATNPRDVAAAAIESLRPHIRASRTPNLANPGKPLLPTPQSIPQTGHQIAAPSSSVAVTDRPEKPGTADSHPLRLAPSSESVQDRADNQDSASNDEFRMSTPTPIPQGSIASLPLQKAPMKSVPIPVPTPSSTVGQPPILPSKPQSDPLPPQPLPKEISRSEHPQFMKRSEVKALEDTGETVFKEGTRSFAEALRVYSATHDIYIPKDSPLNFRDRSPGDSRAQSHEPETRPNANKPSTPSAYRSPASAKIGPASEPYVTLLTSIGGREDSKREVHRDSRSDLRERSNSHGSTFGLPDKLPASRPDPIATKAIELPRASLDRRLDDAPRSDAPVPPKDVPRSDSGRDGYRRDYSPERRVNVDDRSYPARSERNDYLRVRPNRSPSPLRQVEYPPSYGRRDWPNNNRDRASTYDSLRDHDHERGRVLSPRPLREHERDRDYPRTSSPPPVRRSRVADYDDRRSRYTPPRAASWDREASSYVTLPVARSAGDRYESRDSFAGAPGRYPPDEPLQASRIHPRSPSPLRQRDPFYSGARSAVPESDAARAAKRARIEEEADRSYRPKPYYGDRGDDRLPLLDSRDTRRHADGDSGREFIRGPGSMNRDVRDVPYERHPSGSPSRSPLSRRPYRSPSPRDRRVDSWPPRSHSPRAYDSWDRDRDRDEYYRDVYTRRYDDRR